MIIITLRFIRVIEQLLFPLILLLLLDSRDLALVLLNILRRVFVDAFLFKLLKLNDRVPDVLLLLES
jgi:hypothetical protein